MPEVRWRRGFFSLDSRNGMERGNEPLQKYSENSVIYNFSRWNAVNLGNFCGHGLRICFKLIGRLNAEKLTSIIQAKLSGFFVMQKN